MTDEEVEAMRAADRARFERGELSIAEVEKKAEASRLAMQYRAQQARIIECAVRLADATGCPEGEPVFPWLVKHGLVVKHDDGGFEITERGTIFAKAQSIIDEAFDK
jgi:hypothetical protein